MREQWGRLTNDRMCVIAGQHDRVAGRAQEQYGVFKEKTRRELRQFIHRNRKWDPSNR